MKKIINIEGMACMKCVARVEKALSGLSGVTEVKVNLENKTAEIEAENVTDKILKETIEDLGFDVKGIE